MKFPVIPLVPPETLGQAGIMLPAHMGVPEGMFMMPMEFLYFFPLVVIRHGTSPISVFTRGATILSLSYTTRNSF